MHLSSPVKRLDDGRHAPGVDARAVAVRVALVASRIGGIDQAALRHHPVGRLLLGEPDVEIELLPQRRVEDRVRRRKGVGRLRVHVEAVRVHHRVRRVADLNDGIARPVGDDLRKHQNRGAPIRGRIGPRRAGGQACQHHRYQRRSSQLPAHEPLLFPLPLLPENRRSARGFGDLFTSSLGTRSRVTHLLHPPQSLSRERPRRAHRNPWQTPSSAAGRGIRVGTGPAFRLPPQSSRLFSASASAVASASVSAENGQLQAEARHSRLSPWSFL